MNNINDFIAAMQDAQAKGVSLDGLLQNTLARASSGKTALGLNRWVDTDKPKMEDFNRDNEILDREIAALKSNKSDKISPSIYDLPVEAVYGESSWLKYFKTQENIVHIIGFLSKNSGVIGYSENLATLPIGYRPQIVAMIPVVLNSPISIGLMTIHNDGSMNLRADTVTTETQVYFSISFLAQ